MGGVEAEEEEEKEEEAAKWRCAGRQGAVWMRDPNWVVVTRAGMWRRGYAAMARDRSFAIVWMERLRRRSDTATEDGATFISIWVLTNRDVTHL